jgi:hypothetical protein
MRAVVTNKGELAQKQQVQATIVLYKPVMIILAKDE